VKVEVVWFKNFKSLRQRQSGTFFSLLYQLGRISVTSIQRHLAKTCIATAHPPLHSPYTLQWGGMSPLVYLDPINTTFLGSTRVCSFPSIKTVSQLVQPFPHRSPTCPTHIDKCQPHVNYVYKRATSMPPRVKRLKCA